MTDYKGAKGSSTPSWKKRESNRKWQRTAAILFCLVFFFAAINGLLKSAFAVISFSKPKWDGQSTFSVSLNTDPVSVFVFQKDPKRIALFSVPIKQNESDLDKLKDSVSDILGVKIENYIALSGSQNLDLEKQKEIVENLTSISTPLKILAFGWGEDVIGTNITRIDAIWLWWQIKGFGIKDLDYSDLGQFTSKGQEKDRKVLGVDTDSIARQVSPYFLNQKLVEENLDIVIQDATASESSASFAVRFIENVGGKVISVESSPSVSSCTVVTDENSYTSSYLANLFDCDIKGAQSERKSSKVTLILGTDFSK